MMRMRLILILCPLLAAAQPAILVEGARLITGDGDAPVENSAFLIENNKFSRVGKKGQITAPAGAMRVDLTGKTVMPSLVDAHTHVGGDVLRTGRMGADTYTKENLIDHLRREVASAPTPAPTSAGTITRR